MDSLVRGFEFLRSQQTERGSLHGDYDGPLFLLPGYVFAHVATHTPLGDLAVVDTLYQTQNSDGGWGLHLDGPSALFTSVLSYVALRLVGMSYDDDAAVRARRFILSRGGAGNVASWGKYWLCILNLHDWDGVHPVSPELWAAPSWLPAHPRTWWCYARTVYLPIAYLYGRRWQMPLSSLTRALREELYDRPYAEVRFSALRDSVDARDRYAAPGWLLRVLQAGLGLAERWIPAAVRERSLSVVLDHLYYEDRVTDFLDLGPVSKTLNVVAAFAAAPTSKHTQTAIAALPRYLFPCERGVTMQAYNSTELWDTALATLALADAGLERQADFARAALRFIDDSQIRDDLPDGAHYFRDRRRGGWTFSTRASGWPVADCTALGILSSLALAPVVDQPLSTVRLRDAVELLLRTQNDDGGWSTCERRRGSPLLERLNPSELFANAMVDHSHVEITALVIVALVAARPLGVSSDRSLQRALRFVRKHQRSDGSWEGAWGIAFTYGTMFGVWALRAAGATDDDPALKRAADFLAGIQHADGGWGESIRGCTERRYVPSPDGSQPAMTAWAVLGLHRAQPRHPAIARGTSWLRAHQQPNGDWASSAMTGVFNRTCALNYRYYRSYFPLWALALAGAADEIPT